MKSFSFEKMGFTMDIPRVISIGSMAVRVMYTKYDHLSPLSKSFHPKLKVKPPEVVVDEVVPAEEADGEGVMFFFLFFFVLDSFNKMILAITKSKSKVSDLNQRSN